MVISGEIKSRDQLQRVKVKMSGEYKLPEVPQNSAILAEATPEERRIIEPFLVKKPIRTLSGVAVVAVMTSPHPCPHGKCSYCPGGTDSPQSYTGKEPAARRASRNEFDPYSQVTDRITQLEAIGHGTGKIDLIIMGGTFTSRELDYQEGFVKRCFDAMNGADSETMEDAKRINETAEHRCIGLTVETRPDVFTKEQIDTAMRLGATRVELGVQILDDNILTDVERGHGTEAVIRATRECRDAGLKICYHIMPGLPGSDPEKDLRSFRKMFDDPDYRPDMLKIYTTLVISGTKLYDMWAAGEYVPYNEATAVKLIADMKESLPEYARIQRIQRDIPAPQISAGILKSNIREMVADELKARGKECRCIRCREAGHRTVPDNEPTEVKITEYEAAGGTEYFISSECGDAIIGYARLRVVGKEAYIREVKVFGKMAGIGDVGEWQHRGTGKELVSIAEDIAKKSGADSIRVTSGVGVREYYRSVGYRLEEPYMVKGTAGKGQHDR